VLFLAFLATSLIKQAIKISLNNRINRIDPQYFVLLHPKCLKLFYGKNFLFISCVPHAHVDRTALLSEECSSVTINKFYFSWWVCNILTSEFRRRVITQKKEYNFQNTANA
jgi:hypothetical protein